MSVEKAEAARELINEAEPGTVGKLFDLYQNIQPAVHVALNYAVSSKEINAQRAQEMAKAYYGLTPEQQQELRSELPEDLPLTPNGNPNWQLALQNETLSHEIFWEAYSEQVIDKISSLDQEEIEAHFRAAFKAAGFSAEEISMMNPFLDSAWEHRKMLPDVVRKYLKTMFMDAGSGIGEGFSAVFSEESGDLLTDITTSSSFWGGVGIYGLFQAKNLKKFLNESNNKQMAWGATKKLLKYGMITGALTSVAVLEQQGKEPLLRVGSWAGNIFVALPLEIGAEVTEFLGGNPAEQGRQESEELLHAAMDPNHRKNYEALRTVVRGSAFQNIFKSMEAERLARHKKPQGGPTADSLPEVVEFSSIPHEEIRAFAQYLVNRREQVLSPAALKQYYLQIEAWNTNEDPNSNQVQHLQRTVFSLAANRVSQYLLNRPAYREVFIDALKKAANTQTAVTDEQFQQEFFATEALVINATNYNQDFVTKVASLGMSGSALSLLIGVNISANLMNAVWRSSKWVGKKMDNLNDKLGKEGAEKASQNAKLMQNAALTFGQANSLSSVKSSAKGLITQLEAQGYITAEQAAKMNVSADQIKSADGKTSWLREQIKKLNIMNRGKIEKLLNNSYRQAIEEQADTKLQSIDKAQLATLISGKTGNQILSILRGKGLPIYYELIDKHQENFSKRLESIAMPLTVQKIAKAGKLKTIKVQVPKLV